MRRDGTETILLAEDFGPLRDALRRALESLGYRVLAMEDGLAAMEAAASAGHIDLLVTDLCMPRLSARDLALQLLKLRPGLKVLFISTNPTTLHDRVYALPAGSRFFQKPFAADELTEMVRELLDEDAGPPPAPAR